jgi:glutathione S-transferase
LLAGHVPAPDIQGAATNASSRSEAIHMADIILHHYGTSPYSEKVRLGLGLKGLAWASVEIPVIMPKPDLTALTGGYRKTPVLQIGADIYCDSQLIMRELERRQPSPSFYPAGRGAADALAWWAEKTMFNPAVGIAFAKRPDALPEGFLEDRVKFSGRNIDPAVMMAAVPNLLDQLRAHFYWLDQMLANGRAFLQGSAPGLADLAAYHPIWFLKQNFGSTPAPLDGFPRLLAWAKRVADIGHGERSPMTSRTALDVARTATSIAKVSADPHDPSGRQPGQIVSVTPDDTGRDPVVGELITSGVDEIVIRRGDHAVGEVCVHFPRAGFVVTTA